MPVQIGCQMHGAGKTHENLQVSGVIPFGTLRDASDAYVGLYRAVRSKKPLSELQKLADKTLPKAVRVRPTGTFEARDCARRTRRLNRVPLPFTHRPHTFSVTGHSRGGPMRRPTSSGPFARTVQGTQVDS